MGAPTVSEAIGEQIARARHRRGWTQQHLAERLAEHGSHLDRGAVAKIESSTRGVSLDEWLILAAALNVPPPLLLMPLGVEDAVAITPTRKLSPWQAVEWLLGAEPMPDSDPHWWSQASEPLDLYVALRGAEQDAADARRHAEVVEGTGRDATEARATYRSRLLDLVRAVDRMAQAGYDVEGLVDSQLLDDADAEGVRSSRRWARLSDLMAAAEHDDEE